MLQNKPVTFYLTDRDISLLHRSLLDVAKVAVKEAPPDEGYAWAKMAIQLDEILHKEELCASEDLGVECHLENNKRIFAKKYQDFIKEEIKPFNQTK